MQLNKIIYILHMSIFLCYSPTAPHTPHVYSHLRLLTSWGFFSYHIGKHAWHVSNLNSDSRFVPLKEFYEMQDKETRDRPGTYWGRGGNWSVWEAWFGFRGVLLGNQVMWKSESKMSWYALVLMCWFLLIHSCWFSTYFAHMTLLTSFHKYDIWMIFEWLITVYSTSMSDFQNDLRSKQPTMPTSYG